MMESSQPQPSITESAPREESLLREWKRPSITELPRLNELTLQSGGIPGGGGTGGGGSTVTP
jgi:hypothetical protein